MTTFCNQSTLDRAVRIGAGALLLLLGWTGVVPGLLGVAFKILGGLPLVTGLLGWCPLYAALGIRSGPRGGSRPS